jgi:tape measure domain-containing protein
MALNIGNINFGVDASTAGLQKAIAQLDKFQKKTDQVARSQVQGAQRAATARARQESAIKKAFQATVQLQQQQRKAGAAPEQIARVSNAFRRLTKEMTSGKLSTVEYNRAVDAFTARMGRARRSLKDFTDQANKGKQGLAKYSVLFRDLESSAVLALGPLSGLGARIRSLSAIFSRSSLRLAALVTGIAVAVITLGKLAAAAVRAGAEMKGIQLRLEAATGSAALGAQEFGFVIRLAKSLGLEMAVLARSYARFTAASQGTSIEGRKTREIFEQVARASAALKLTGADVEGVMRAIEQIMSKGTVQAEELRGQLGDRLPGAFRIAAEAMGVTTRELNRMLKAGELISDGFLPRFAKRLDETVGANAEKNLTTLSGQMNNLSTNWTLFLDNMDRTFGLSTAAAFAVHVLSKRIESAAGIFGKTREEAEAFNKEWETMIEVMRQVENITPASKSFQDVANAIREASIEMAVAQDTLTGFRRGEGDIMAIQEALRLMVDTTALNNDEIEAMADRLSLLTGLNVPATARGIADGITAMTEATKKSNAEIKKIEQAPEVFAKIQEQMAGLRAQAEALSQGPAVAEIFEDIGQPVMEFERELAGANLTTERHAALLAEYEALLTTITTLEDAHAEALKAKADALRDAEQAQRRMERATTRAGNSIAELRAEVTALSLGADALEKFEKIDQPMIRFKQALMDAGVHGATLNALEAEYLDLLEQKFRLTDKWHRAGEQAAKAVTNGLEDIILKGGSVKDMLHDLSKELLRIALRALFLDNLQSSLSSFFGGGGFGGLVSVGAGAAVGVGTANTGGGDLTGLSGSFASGGSFKLGGSGGSDSVPFFGMGKAGETVTVSRPDQGAPGGANVTINQTNNFTGPLSDPAQLIPLLEENNRKLKGEIIDELDRGQYR